MTHLSAFRSHPLSSVALVLAVACAADDENARSPVDDTVGVTGSMLMAAAETCEDVDEALVEQFRSDLKRLFATGQCVTTPWNGVGVPSIGIDGDWSSDSGEGSPVMGAGGSAAIGAAGATSVPVSGDNGGLISDGSGRPETVTGTNVQVSGVDEGDIVKTDGRNLYVLHDNILEMVQASTSGAMTSVTSLRLEGQVREMYVVGSADQPTRQVVVIADVAGEAVYGAAGVPVPSSSPGSVGGAVGGGAVDSGSIAIDAAMPADEAPVVVVGAGGASSEPNLATAGTGNASIYPSGWVLQEGVAVAPAPTGAVVGVNAGSWGMVPMTKVTVLEATDTALSLKSQAYYDGAYQSSRRTDDRLHLVLSIQKNWPALDACPTNADRLKAEMVVIEQLLDDGKEIASIPAEQLEDMVAAELVDNMLEDQTAALSQLTAAEFLPRRFVLEGAQLSASQLECASIFMPRAGSSVSGVTYLAEIDLGEPTADAGSAAILGQSHILYGGGGSLVLGTNQGEIDPETGMYSEIAYVHRFELGADGVAYSASAGMVGRIKDQFSFDVTGDDLRVVSSEGWWTEQRNSLSVLREVDDSGLLTEIGRVDGIGDGEDVKAVRFLGERAYVVTFLQTDPLFVLDVSDPEAPELLGGTPEIPGFSTYLHPLDEGHLLTVGYDADGWTPAIQIFDVSQPTAPDQLHKLALSSDGSSSSLSDYKAFTYYPEQKLLAIPFARYSGRPLSSMMLFKIDLVSGITKLGEVDGDFVLGLPLPSDSESCYQWGDSQSLMSRSVFFDQTLFAVAQRGIASVDATNPSQVHARMVFASATETQSGYCDVWYTGEGGATGVGGATSDGVGGAESVGSAGSAPVIGVAGGASVGAGGADAGVVIDPGSGATTTQVD